MPIIIALFVGIFFYFIGSSSTIPMGASSLEIISQNNNQLNLKPAWSITDKIEEARMMLEGINLFVGEEEITYLEDRLVSDNIGNLIPSKIKISEEAKEIALALLNKKTGDIEIVVIKKDGDKLIAPDGFEIDIVTRPSGIRWNYWNTHYKVVQPEEMMVIGNRYPQVKNITTTQRVRNKRGDMVSINKIQRGIEYVYYVPYSDDLHNEEIITKGQKYIRETVALAFAELKKRKVISKAVPGSLVANVEALKASFFEHLPLLEQTDLGEFIINPNRTAERTLAIIGANGEEAFSKTCNSSSACGWVQFIPQTYTSIRRIYVSAKLKEDLDQGRADHLNSIMAAILLHDYNLADLVDLYGNKIMSDPRLEEYLAAAYNGRPSWVHQSLNATLGKVVSDWTKHLRKETLGFIVKLRYIRDNNLV